MVDRSSSREQRGLAEGLRERRVGVDRGDHVIRRCFETIASVASAISSLPAVPRCDADNAWFLPAATILVTPSVSPSAARGPTP